MNNVHGTLVGAGSYSELSPAEGKLVTESAPVRDVSLSRLPRLMKRAEFVAASAGRRVHSGRMTVQIWDRSAGPHPDAGRFHGPRFGLTVTKKTANAVGRNRIRRRLRALISQLRPFWPQTDTDFVIVGRAEMLTASVDAIVSDLKRAFSSSPRQGTPRNRGSQPPHHGRGRGVARSHDTVKPT